MSIGISGSSATAVCSIPSSMQAAWQAGSYSGQVVYIDSNGNCAPVGYTWAQATAIWALPVWGATSPVSGTVGTAYSQTFPVAGGTGAYTFTDLSSPSMSSIGLALTNSSGQALLSGTPTTNSGSPYTLSFKVTDSHTPTANSATQSFGPLTITAAATPLNTPTLTPPSGNLYPSGVNVTVAVTGAPSGTNLCWNVGSAPTSTSGGVCATGTTITGTSGTAALSGSSTETLYAIATTSASGYTTPSSVASANYTYTAINPPVHDTYVTHTASGSYGDVSTSITLAGDGEVVLVAVYAAGSTVSSIAVTTGSGTCAVSATVLNTGADYGFGYCYNVTRSSGSATINATLAGTVSSPIIYLDSFSNVPTTNPIDAFYANGGSSPYNGGTAGILSLTPTQVNDMLWGFAHGISCTGGTFTYQSPFASLEVTGGTPLAYVSVSGTSTYTPGFVGRTGCTNIPTGGYAIKGH
jgi:hypothetical protein